MSNDEQTPPEPAPQQPSDTPALPRDRSGSKYTRSIWMATGVSFFGIGLVFTLTMPDNFALGITFLGLGVVFFSLAGSKRAPGDGPGDRPGTQPGTQPGIRSDAPLGGDAGADHDVTPESDSENRPPA